MADDQQAGLFQEEPAVELTNKPIENTVTVSLPRVLMPKRTHIVHRNFQGPHHAKGQALYSGLCYGLGGALGSLYSGELWVAWGPAWVFAAAAGCSLLALLIAWPRVARR